MQLPTSPDGFRQRYLDLQRAAQERNARKIPPSDEERNPNPLPEALILHEEVIPGGWYWTTTLKRGTTLRLITEGGAGGVSALFWNADDTSERYFAGDTVKVQWHTCLTRGRLILSDMGRVLASVTEDRSGGHDTLSGGSSAATNLQRYGRADLRNTRDNFLLAAGKHGLGSRDIPPCLTFFAPVRTDEEGRLLWRDGVVQPGDFIDLRAEMNLLVALSNCPHPLDPRPQWAPSPARAVTWRSPAPTALDLCRNASDEAIRAFENTDALFRGDA
ncbi:MAG TPA: urea amidolyase associated protein UAAP1 [Stellaceae bacterium]|nr:urea amidolyase associated protein UAAP1 [Stellaceae bacterium]